MPLPITEQFPGESAGGKTAECTGLCLVPEPADGLIDVSLCAQEFIDDVQTEAR
jgi:hypothetical protein